MKKIVVFRYDKVGDLLVSTPAFRAIKEAYPECHLTLVASPYNRVAAEGLETIDEIWELEKKQSIAENWAFLKKLRAHKPDLVLNFNPCTVAYFLNFLSGAKQRGALLMSYRWLPKILAPVLFTKSIILKRSFYKKRDLSKHHTSYLLQLCERFGIKASPDLQLETANFSEAAKDLAPALNKKGKYLAFHLLDTWQSEDMTANCFCKILANVRKTYPDYQILLTAGPLEKKLYETCQKLYPTLTKQPSAIQTYQAASYQHLCAALSGAAAVISPNTGIVHIAAALQRPCVVLEPKGRLQMGCSIEYAPYKVPFETFEMEDADITSQKLIDALSVLLRALPPTNEQADTSAYMSSLALDGDPADRTSRTHSTAAEKAA